MTFSTQAGLASIRTDLQSAPPVQLTEPPALVPDGITEVPNLEPIPYTVFYLAARKGHFQRTGHALTGFLVTNCDGITTVSRTCC